MSPAGLLFLLVGCAVLTLLFLVATRSRRAVARQASAEVALPEYKWRWGAACAGLAFTCALLCAASFFDFRIYEFSEWPPAVRVSYIVAGLTAAAGLAQQRRFGVLALAAFAAVEISVQWQRSYAAGGISLVFLYLNWLYFKKRWPAMRW
jgi:hypothetical protein